MARRSPPRKVAYFEPVPPRLARNTGWSFATVWRRAESAGIELTAGREAKGFERLSSERRAKVEEARQLNPKVTQEEVARAAGKPDRTRRSAATGKSARTTRMPGIFRGTEGSNPSPSSGESIANLAFL
jgi:hypothetical protein